MQADLKNDKNSRLVLFLKRYWVLILLVFIKISLQYFLVNPYYEPHRDEYLYLDQAKHLAFGYISVPPFTALLSKLVFLLGGGIFWIRFFPALFGAGTIIFAWLTTETIGGRTSAKVVVAMALLFSVYARLNILYQPNSFDILIWTAAFYFLVNYLKTRETKWLFIIMVTLAAGMYNKYTVAFLSAGIIGGLLLTGLRKVFLTKAFWLAVLTAFIFFLPNLLWQVSHNFPVIDHMRELNRTQLVNISYTGFIKGQVIIQIGSIALVIAGLISLFRYRPFNAFRTIGISFVIIFLLFLALRAKDYYTLGLYPVIIAFGTVFLEKTLSNRYRSIVFSVMIALNVIIFVLIMRFLFPVLKPEKIVQETEIFEKIGLLRWEDGKNHMLPQDFSDMTGWREMADKALAAYRRIPENEIGNTLVFCDNYGETGALNYFNRGKMKEAYSFNTDYIYWLPEIKSIKNVLLVGEPPDENIVKMFAGMLKTDSVVNEYSREKGTGIFLFTGADSTFTKFFYDEAERRKRELDIF
jgi:hypothetical protein